MKIDFKKVVTACAEILKHRKFEINIEKENIISLKLENFSIRIFYSAYEYEADIAYLINSENLQLDIDSVLLAAKCREVDLPKFLYMSNESIMAEYIQAYLNLVDKYYDELNQTENILKNYKLFNKG